MESVTVTRTFDAAPATIQSAMERIGPFMRAAGFDEVAVDGDTVRVANRVGIARIELTLDLIEDAETDLAYEQREGIFEEMRTTYAVSEVPDGCEVVATTDFALDVPVVGDALDATVIKRQRTKELEAQFDWLEAQVGDGS
jgi:hypothetical protein